MQISINYTGTPKNNSLRTQSKLQSRPIHSPSHLSFQGTKTTVAGGLAAGLLTGYYMSMALMAPPIVEKCADDIYLRGVEYRIAATLISGSDSVEEQSSIKNEILDDIDKNPNDYVTQKSIEIAEKYDFFDDADKTDIVDTVNSAFENKQINKESQKFYKVLLKKIVL